MAFPSSPINNQYYAVNNNLFKYNLAQNSWTKINDPLVEVTAVADYDLLEKPLSGLAKDFYLNKKDLSQSGISYDKGELTNTVSFTATASQTNFTLGFTIPDVNSDGIPDSTATTIVYVNGTIVAQYYKGTDLHNTLTWGTDIALTTGGTILTFATGLNASDAVVVDYYAGLTYQEDIGYYLYTDFTDYTDGDIMQIESKNATPFGFLVNVTGTAVTLKTIAGSTVTTGTITSTLRHKIGFFVAKGSSGYNITLMVDDVSSTATNYALGGSQSVLSKISILQGGSYTINTIDLAFSSNSSLYYLFSNRSIFNTNINNLSDIIQTTVEYRRDVGELFYRLDYAAPAAFDGTQPHNYNPAICLNTQDQTLDIAHWPDVGGRKSLVSYLRDFKAKYNDGMSAQQDFTITNWNITSNVATITFTAATGELAMLAANLESSAFHGVYVGSINLPVAVGDITAGDYEITSVNAVSATVSFNFTAADNSGSGTWVANFYPFRIVGSTTTAKIKAMQGLSLMSVNDGDSLHVGGYARRSFMPGHWHNLSYGTAGGTVILSNTNFLAQQASGGPWIAHSTKGADNTVIVENPITDGTNGVPRTGKETESRSFNAHLYIHGGRYI